MNTPALISRLDPARLPTPSSWWSPEHPDASAPPLKLPLLLRRYGWMLAASWLLVGVPSTLAIYHWIKPAYLAVGAVRVAPVRPDLIKDNDRAMPFYREFVETQARLIQSTRVLSKAAEDPRLKHYPWFNDLSDPLDFLSEKIKIDQSSGQLITLSAQHPDANAAADLVNATLDAYSRINTEEEENDAGKQIKILTQFRKTLEDYLETSQQRLRQAESSTLLSAEDQRHLLTDMLGQSRQTLAKLDSDRLSLQHFIEGLKKTPEFDTANYRQSLPSDSDPQIAMWNSEQVRLQDADLTLKSRQATDEHPQRQEISRHLQWLEEHQTQRREAMRNQSLQQIQAGLALERSKRLQESQNDLQTLEAQITRLSQRIDSQEHQAKDLQEKILPILTLKEQITDTKESLKRYNDRIQELESKNVSPGRVSIGWNATPPATPKVDRRLKLAASAQGGSLALGFLLLLLMGRLRQRIEELSDLPHGMQPLVVGTISQSNVSIRGNQSQVQRRILNEEMRLVHANLLTPAASGTPERRLIVITSPTPGEGKTSISAQLALSLAKAGLETLLIDADLRKRDLTRLFEQTHRSGLAELLQGQKADLSNPVELLPNFHFLGAGGQLQRNPAELFQRQEFRQTLAPLHPERFDCILVDTPPTLVVADARLIARSCDEILCVLRARVSSSHEAREAIDTLMRLRGQMPKLILNGINLPRDYYKYKFAYTRAEVTGT